VKHRWFRLNFEGLDILRVGPRLHKKGLQSRINVTDNTLAFSQEVKMSVSLRKKRESGRAFPVIESRLKGTSRGLGYWAAWDAAPKVGYNREAVKKKLSQ